MANKDYLKDLLIKISTIFPKDAYIINNMYCIEGPLSKSETAGYYICQLSPEVMNFLKEKFKRSEIIYLKNIKNAKTDFNEPNVQIVKNEDDIQSIKKKIKELRSVTTDPKNKWASFKFTENDLTDLFDECKFITLFENDSVIPPIEISKTLLPLITRKNIDCLTYAVQLGNNDDELTKLIMDFDHELFHLFMIYEYLKTE